MTVAYALRLPLADSATAYAAGWHRGWTVRELGPIDEWADENRVLPRETSKEAGRWRTDRNPLARGPMRSLGPHSGAEIVTICAGTQTIKTETGNNAVGYWIDQDPCTVIVVQPTKALSDAWKLMRFDPLAELTPAVGDKIQAMGSGRRDSSNTLARVRFPGGWLIVSHAESAKSLAMYSARYLFLDEIDSYSTDTNNEGDPLATAYRRTETFGERRKILQVSSPKKLMGASLIWREYLRGDQRQPYVPCPKCDAMQILQLEQITPDGEYLCEHCGHAIPHSAKTAMLAAHEWRPKYPERTKHHSYRASSLYSPVGLGRTWLDLRQEYDEVADNPPRLKAFVSTSLAIPYEDKDSQLDPDVIKSLAEDWHLRQPPPGCLPLTAAVDLQKDRFELLILGYGRGSSPRDPQIYVIDYAVIPASPIDPDCWEQLDDYLSRPMTNAYGVETLPTAIAVDSGNWTREANLACHARRQRGWIAIKGASAIAAPLIGPPRQHDLNNRGKWQRHGGRHHMVNTHSAKDTILARLVVAPQQPQAERWWHLPKDLPDAFYAQIASEVRDPESGRWERIGATRNEVPDMAAYAWAIAHLPSTLRLGTRTERYWQRDEDTLQPVQSELFSAPAESRPPVGPSAGIDIDDLQAF